jgi:hypothetical protein
MFLINAPATSMNTIYEMLNQSVQIKNSLHLDTIVVEADQEIYAKAAKIVWKHRDKFHDIILRMGAFHPHYL